RLLEAAARPLASVLVNLRSGCPGEPHWAERAQGISSRQHRTGYATFPPYIPDPRKAHNRQSLGHPTPRGRCRANPLDVSHLHPWRIIVFTLEGRSIVKRPKSLYTSLRPQPSFSPPLSKRFPGPVTGAKAAKFAAAIPRRVKFASR